MRNPESAELTAGEWQEALQELALCCVTGQAGDHRERLHELNALLALAPPAGGACGLRPLTPKRLTTLLAAGAPESAALAMLSDGAGYILSSDNVGNSLATIALPGSLQEVSGSGSTPTLALIAALALALAALTPVNYLAACTTRLDRHGTSLH